MNSEQVEHRILSIIRETAKRHGVGMVVRVGELTVNEYGQSRTAATITYSFNRLHRWLPLLRTMVLIASSYMLASVVWSGVTGIKLGYPWPAVPMVAAILLYSHIQSKPEMTPAMWDQIIWEELTRNGFLSFRDSTGLVQVHIVE